MAAPAVRELRREDAEAVLAVWEARDVADIGEPDYSLEDVLTDLESPGIQALVAELDGRIVGAAAMERDGAIVGVHPEAEGRGVGSALRGEVERRTAALGERAARQHVASANASGRAHLEAAGYAPTYFFVKLEAPRDALPDAPPELPGRRVYAPEDARACFEVSRDAFADIPGDTGHHDWDSYRVEVFERESFRPDLSFVLCEGEAVAGCALTERRGDEGHVNILALRRHARGAGRGRALLASALAAIRADGCAKAGLWVNGANAPALGLYESLGMRAVTRQERWERALDA